MTSLRRRLINQLKVTMYQPSDVVLEALANTIMGDVDRVLSQAFGHLADMGWPKRELMKIKRIIKKKL